MTTSASSSPSNSKQDRRALAIVVVVIGATIVGGYFGYRSSLQPNIQLTEASVQTLVEPETFTVLNEMVSGTHSFSYEATRAGTYSMVFDNSYSLQEYRYKEVKLNYMVGGESRTEIFEIPPLEKRSGSVELSTGDVVSGSFSVAEKPLSDSEAHPADVQFEIVGSTCTQIASVEFTLTNSGTADAYVTVVLVMDGKASVWSNTYHLNPGRQIVEAAAVALPDCQHHDFHLEAIHSTA